jgi:hypothetical protein
VSRGVPPVKNIVGKIRSSTKKIECHAFMRDACGQAISPAIFALVESNRGG